MSLHLGAQTLTTLHHFSGTDGRWPHSSLTLSGNTLYGTTSLGGNSDSGTVFALSTDGQSFTNLYRFTAAPSGVNTDGARPEAGLVLSSNSLYGTTYVGGTIGGGTVFGLNTDGSGFTVLANFTSFSDGVGPFGGLTLSGSTLYGTTRNTYGAVFAIDPNSPGVTTLYGFAGGSDGASPNAALILSGDTLYGTTISSNGTVFSVNIDGSGFQTLHAFSNRLPAPTGPYGTNSDGAKPFAGLALSGSTLYGAANLGGEFGQGTLFSLNTDGSGFKTLHTFAALPALTNYDGAQPYAAPILSGTTLYGSCQVGGKYGSGTIWAVNADGTGFTVIYNFSATVNGTNSDGVGPAAPLLLSGNRLYGTALTGGNSGNGTVFSISLPSPPPQLTIAPDGYGGFFIAAQGSPNFTCQLQRAPTLSGPWTTSASQTADTNGLILFHDLFPPQNRAFYRTVQQ